MKPCSDAVLALINDTIAGNPYLGVPATRYAGFATNSYKFSGTSYASLSAWLAAMGGTYSRSGPATYLQSGVIRTAASGVPRFPTDINGNPTGLRLTGAITNVCLFSGDLSNATTWGVDGGGTGVNAVVTGNFGIAPDGTLTAARVQLNKGAGTSAGDYSRVQQGLTVASALYTDAIWIRTNDGSTKNVGMQAGSGGSRICLATPTWTRFALNTVVPTVNPNISVLLWGLLATDNTADLLVWGGGVFALPDDPGDYVPTTSAPATQNADVLSFPFTSTTFSALVRTINQRACDPSNVPRIIGTELSAAPIFLVPIAGLGFSTFNGATQLLGPSIPDFGTAPHAVMLTGSPSGRSIMTDGATPTSDGDALIASPPSNMFIGSNQNVGDWAYGDFSLLAVWDNLTATVADLQTNTSASAASREPALDLTSTMYGSPQQFQDFDLYTITLPAAASDFNSDFGPDFATLAPRALRFTTADFDINANGFTYTSTLRIDERSSKVLAHWKEGFNVDTWVVVVMPRPVEPLTGAPFPDTIAGVPWLQAVQGGSLDGCEVVVDRAYFASMPTWPMPPGGAVPVGTVNAIFAGVIGTVDTTNVAAVLSLLDWRTLLSIQAPVHVFAGQCRHTLFDIGCSLAAPAFVVPGQALGGTTQAAIANALATPLGSRTYVQGRVTMTSGLNAGFARTVTGWDGPGKPLRLLVPFPFTIAPGDAFNAYPGCNKTEAACNLFANILNYGGQGRVPAPETAA